MAKPTLNKTPKETAEDLAPDNATSSRARGKKLVSKTVSELRELFGDDGSVLVSAKSLIELRTKSLREQARREVLGGE